MPHHVRKAYLYKSAVLFVVGAPFLGVLAAIVLAWNRYVFLSDITLMLSLYLLTGLGITIGYHRMLTHRSFHTSKPLKALFLICGCMAFEGPPLAWAATHISHHAHSDDEDDPHTPLAGFWHAHMGWMFRNHYEDPNVYAPHLLKDPVIVFVDRTAVIWMTLSLLFPLLVGGWTGLLWGGLVRIFITTHATWSVNSVCHTFGKRPFESSDESRNEWIVGLLAFGEGWHNNHHAFPTSAFHGLHWWQFDLSGLLIRAMEKMGLIWSVERVTPALMEAKLAKTRSIKESVQDFKEQLGIAIAQAKADLTAYFENHKSDLTNHPTILYAEKQARHQLEKIAAEIARRKSLRARQYEKYSNEVRNAVELVKQRAKQEMEKLSPSAL